MPQISVIVPVFKVEPYLRECVDSILAQTFTDFECILVDDGSPDHCGEICDEYAEQDERVRVIHKQNGGTSSARNAGIEAAEGKYICFVDGDDVIDEQFCQLLYEMLLNYQTDISACRMKRFSTDIDFNSDSGAASVRIFSCFEALHEQMYGHLEMGVCNKLFRRSVFQSLAFQEGKRYEDILFFSELLKKQEMQIAFSDAPLYYYRQRSDSYMNSQKKGVHCNPDWVFAVSSLLECCEATDYPELNECICYSVNYPWSFIDPIYVDFRFRENHAFLQALQGLLRDHLDEINTLPGIDNLQKKRMLLFARSRFLYGFNAYTRLIRVYLFHILKKDPYADGHGI